MIEAPERHADPTGNARITGAFGALLLVLLAAEGLTILLRVRDTISWHVFLGMVLVPPVVVKTASTGYRFARYYTGDRAYVEKGPPPPILRLAGPFVVLLTAAVLGTGVASLLAGPDTRWLAQAHKLTFVAWFGVTAIHVLGHALETPALAAADWRRRTRAGAPRAGLRVALLLCALLAGIALGVLSLDWIGAWGQAKQLG